MRHNFVDEVTVQVRSGNGGPGCVAFRREKYIPFGGPSGGDGGRGGHVLVRVDPQMATLLDYRFRPHQEAANGGPGEGRQCHGADGADKLLRVPQGTHVWQVRPHEPDVLLADLNAPKAEYLLAKGGRGGRGNEFFKSSIHQAPTVFQPGDPGMSLTVRLELKLLADVGLVGFPNVGKSSLVARVSACRPKIADYPFTTLVPNLGMVRLEGWTDFVMADVPGLVPGAHAGVGLGNRFLRHLERVRVLVHVVTTALDWPGRSVEADIDAIENELKQHPGGLHNQPRVLVLNRMDLPEVVEQAEAVAQLAQARGWAFFAISAATGAGTGPLLAHLGQAVSRHRAEAA